MVGFTKLVNQPYSSLAGTTLGCLAGYCVFKLNMSIEKRRSYNSIEFGKEEFTVFFDYRPQLTIRYDDVVRIDPAFESTPTYLTITGNYPILHLSLYDLENNMHKKFVRFLENRLSRLSGI